jgi:hypothetical protein
MKIKKGILILAVLALAAVIGAARLCLERTEANGASASAVKKSDYYYCAMHPWFHQDHPGNCGICGMTLIKKEGGAPSGKESTAPLERKVKYWVDSMNPAFHQDHPGKAPDGMDLVPIYDEGTAEPGEVPAALKGLASVNLSPFKQQLIGLRTSTVKKQPVVRVIHTVGRYAGGSNDFASIAGDFAARGKGDSGRKGFLVADVYALDIPYVKVGQRVWVSPFSGAGPRLEGLVSQIYPYDGTQSRVRRVKISVSQVRSSELFANVEIEAASQPVLSVPVDAVMVTGLHRYVFVKNSAETFVPREVTMGFEGESEWQVVSGLNGGETVVEGANFMVDADSKLTANFAAMEAQSK